jgi:hypothetical protein
MSGEPLGSHASPAMVPHYGNGIAVNTQAHARQAQTTTAQKPEPVRPLRFARLCIVATIREESQAVRAVTLCGFRTRSAV